MMINSSPEYPITKPGMPSHLLQKREKPLRTYGRKSVPTPEPGGEPVAKKCRIEPERSARPTETVTNLHKCSHSEGDGEPLPSTEEASRSSILKYFKPVTVPKARNNKHGERSRSPPLAESLSVMRTRRKPRLLRIRGTSLQSDMSSEDAFSLSGRDLDGTDAISSWSSRKRGSLHGESEDLLNQNRRDSTCDGKMKDRPRSKRSPTVQTTLNISCQAAFAECRVCDTVWNPLYPDDVKYHEKRHKAVLRIKRKREEDEL